MIAEGEIQIETEAERAQRRAQARSPAVHGWSGWDEIAARAWQGWRLLRWAIAVFVAVQFVKFAWYF